ncbi:MFS transporter [Alkalibaculum sp. M08DMB]|uniref:MFS transporter n=1 Tax=Alkalibaculum sporogenes TaxID=2655001 RepID=A0A6A7KBR7_9FIRM|nr:MFS transporter [Alkalibaculum sporogenes]MPW26721.1 MFS transporter [Alkalibaculum sporogenes]
MSKKKTHYAWTIAVAACLLAFVGTGIFQNCSGIFFKPVADSFHVGRGTVATYIAVQNIVSMFFMLIAGRILPKVNIRVTLSLAVVLVCGTFMGMSQITAMYQFYIAGSLCGIGLAFIGPLVLPILVNNWFEAKAGTVLGVVFAFSSIGGAVFNPFGSIIIQDFGWQAGYLSLGVIGLIVLLPTTLFLVRYKPADIGLQPYGANEGIDATQIQTVVTTQLPGVTSRRALKSPSLYLIIIFTIGSTCLAAFNSAMPGYAESLGMSPALGGTAASVVLLGAIAGKMLLGWLNDKFGIVKASTFAVVMSVIGLSLLIYKAHVVVFLTGAALMGLAFALTGVEPPIITRHVFGLKNFSNIFSYVTMSMLFSSAIAIPLYGFIYDATKSYLPGLIFAFSMLIIGFVSMLAALKFGENLLYEKGI